MGSFVSAAPCDIYASGGTPCVAAHSTTRALYSAYNSSLYQVKRGSDSATLDIKPLSVGGVANAAAQDTAPGGGADARVETNGDDLAGALGAPVTLNGQRAYGVFISPGTGYRNNAANGTAIKDAEEGIYAVFDGTHYNSGCCFDYGNAETSSDDTGDGHMEAIYFGLGTGYDTGAGDGPWILADLENGLFVGTDPHTKYENVPAITSRFVTAIVKGASGNQWAVRGGDANSGSLSTYYSGERPMPGTNNYSPMNKEGAIILGIGGDNSDSSQGTFYEGVMTTGYPSDDIENAVQADIVAQNYAPGARNSGPALSIGSSISFQITTPNLTTRYLAHTGTTVNTQVVTSSDSLSLRQQASWTVRTGLGNSDCFSFESKDTAGSFIRHSNYQLWVNNNDGSKQFAEDATWCTQAGLTGQGSTIRSFSYAAHYFRHFNALGYAAANGGPRDWDTTYLFNDDATWIVGSSFA